MANLKKLERLVRNSLSTVSHAFSIKYFVVALCFIPWMCAGPVIADELPFKIPQSVENLPTKAVIVTTKGQFEFELYPEIAPIAVKNFEYLARKGFYEGTFVTRVVEDFVVEAGNPRIDGRGGPGYTLPPEFSELKHLTGTVGMARWTGENNPERRSTGSQFYICLTNAKHLDGQFTIFAQVRSGMEIVNRLRKGDKILKVGIYK